MMQTVQGRPNGKPIGKPMVLPFIQIIADPANATQENPNGLRVQTNMNPANSDLAIVMMLGEAQRVWAMSLMEKGKRKFSTLTLPDGSPVPLPE